MSPRAIQAGAQQVSQSPAPDSRCAAGGDYTVRLFKAYVWLIRIAEQKYLRRNETNFRTLSKAAAQGSLPWVRKTITKIAVPITSSVRTNPISHPPWYRLICLWNARAQ